MKSFTIPRNSILAYSGIRVVLAYSAEFREDLTKILVIPRNSVLAYSGIRVVLAYSAEFREDNQNSGYSAEFRPGLFRNKTRPSLFRGIP